MKAWGIFFINGFICLGFWNAVWHGNFCSGATHFIAANNDSGVREYDIEKFQLLSHLQFPWPVNVSTFFPVTAYCVQLFFHHMRNMLLVLNLFSISEQTKWFDLEGVSNFSIVLSRANLFFVRENERGNEIKINMKIKTIQEESWLEGNVANQLKTEWDWISLVSLSFIFYIYWIFINYFFASCWHGHLHLQFPWTSIIFPKCFLRLVKSKKKPFWLDILLLCLKIFVILILSILPWF
jgi:hypothetical protein